MSRTQASPAPVRLSDGRRLETRMLDVDLIDASRRNGHDRLGEPALAELKASIAAQGILQPLIVRPVDAGGFELVAGHRRYRCAQLLGLAEVPVQVMSLTEAEAREVQLVENLQRENLAPLDEAEAIAGLLQLVSLDEAAARLGRSRSYLASRTALNRLPQEARLALERGTMSLSVALLVARIPDEALRGQVGAELAKGRDEYGDGEFVASPLTLIEARRALERTMLELKHATFDTSDPMLIVGVPSCVACPYRTGNAPDLFGDVDDADVCTSPECFAAKRDAGWTTRRDAARAKGYELLPDARAKKILDTYGSGVEVRAESGFVNPMARVGRDGDSRTWLQVAKAARAKPQTLVVRHPKSDKPVQLWRADDLRELLPKEEKARLALPKATKPAGEEPAPEKARVPGGPGQYAVGQEALEQVEEAVLRAVGTMPTLAFLQAVATLAWNHYGGVPARERLGLSKRAKFTELPEATCMRAIALYVLREMDSEHSPAAFGVDVKPFMAAARARLLEQAQEKAAAAEEAAAAGAATRSKKKSGKPRRARGGR